MYHKDHTRTRRKKRDNRTTGFYVYILNDDKIRKRNA